MIRCLCLNPSMDKTVSLPEFALETPNRVTPVRTDIGGKGVNVAQAVLALGGQAVLYAFDYSDAPLERKAVEAGIPCRLTQTGEQLRVNLKIWEEKRHRMIEINEPGAIAQSEKADALLSDLLADCVPGDWAVLSGSVPPGMRPDVYRELCQALHQKGCRVAADCDGIALQRIMEAQPDLIKPNADEFHQLTGFDSHETGTLARVCHSFRLHRVCLSLGAKGALLCGREDAYFCPAANVAAQSLQGAGDSMLAGLLTAFSQGKSDPEALAFASAASGATIARPGTLLCSRAETDALYPALLASIRPVSIK